MKFLLIRNHAMTIVIANTKSDYGNQNFKYIMPYFTCILYMYLFNNKVFFKNVSSTVPSFIIFEIASLYSVKSDRMKSADICTASWSGLQDRSLITLLRDALASQS